MSPRKSVSYLPGSSSLVITQIISAQVFDDRMELDREPLQKGFKVAPLRPRCLVCVPAIQLVFEYLPENRLEHLVGVIIVFVLRYEIDGLLARHVRQDSGVVEGRRPIKVRLLGSYDEDCAIEHSCLSGGERRRSSRR